MFEQGFKFFIRPGKMCTEQAIDSRIIVTITMSGALNTSERVKTQFSALAYFFFGFLFEEDEIFVKKWFSCDKNYKSRAFAVALTTLQQFLAVQCVKHETFRPRPSPIEIACI